ncbi:MAG: GntR family transcriptional regulator [Ruminococcaceae bacterium]|nr:GntR family transcriptional regulator [Oscillospiraceae bacterium]
MDMGREAGASRTVFREEIRNAIREAIFSGALKPGDRIIEIAWAKELGVSQGPVREAIRDLEAMGLVETVPFKGSRVRSLTEKDIQDNYSVRIWLESKSISDAIRTLSDETLKALTEELRAILGQMDDCASRGDLRNFTDCDTAFHRTIIIATGNQVLLRLWEQCNMRNWFMFSALTDAESLKQLQSGHQEIYAAICDKDEARATSTLENHLTHLIKGFIQESDI